MLHRLPLPGRLGEAMAGRRRAASRWLGWARRERPAGPLVWLHAASVGEAQAAAPVVSRLRAANNDLVVIHTFTSPAMADWPSPFPASRSDYAPEDHPGTITNLIQELRPALLVISRGDLWPAMVMCAKTAGLPVAIIGGTIRPGSLRLRWPARAVLREACRGLDFVGVISQEDAARWRHAGARTDSIRVTGDPRDATVVERAAPVGNHSAMAGWASRSPVLVAGSTHRADERALADAFSAVLRTNPSARLLVVPHDGGRARPAWRGVSFEWTTWNGVDPLPVTPCVFAAVTGMLADLYLWGCAAYVGGGFDRGVHSVAEPAVFGLPIAAGPDAAIAPEARRFVDAGAVTVLPRRDPSGPLSAWWCRCLEDPRRRWRVGLAGRALLSIGPARITADAVRGLLR